jgi:hypothetical protein
MNGQFQLDRVLDPQFTMPHGPELEQVAFFAITLLPMSYSQMVTLTFLAEIPLTTAYLHQRIQAHVPLRYASVHSLVLEFRFPEEELPLLGRAIYCELTAPNQHNLEGQSAHRQILQYLHRWGLYDGNPVTGFTRST